MRLARTAIAGLAALSITAASTEAVAVEPEAAATTTAVTTEGDVTNTETQDEDGDTTASTEETNGSSEMPTWLKVILGIVGSLIAIDVIRYALGWILPLSSGGAGMSSR